MNESVTQSLTLQELPELRRKTEAVSKFLQDHLTTHLDTLKPLLSPERVFGKLAGGKLEVAGAILGFGIAFWTLLLLYNPHQNEVQQDQTIVN